MSALEAPASVDAANPANSETPENTTSTTNAALLEAFRALANPVRLQVLGWLREPERHFPVQPEITDPRAVGVCVSHIQAKTGLAQSTVSAYMAVLERAGLVRSTRVGKWTHYRRDEEAIGRFVEEIAAAIGAVPAGIDGL